MKTASMCCFACYVIHRLSYLQLAWYRRNFMDQPDPPARQAGRVAKSRKRSSLNKHEPAQDAWSGLRR
jgi:hypothetical protein